MSGERQTIYISDLAQCRPSTALSDRPKKGHWRTATYEAEGVSGTMLVAGFDCHAPTITLPLGVRGWHAVHLGIWTHRVMTTIKVRLSRDHVSRVVTTQPPERWTSNWWATIKEVFWTFADLTDLDLVVSQSSTGQPQNAAIAYAKLEPLTAEEVAAIQRERERTDTRRLIAHNDGGTFVGHRGATTAQDLWTELEPLRDTDFQKLLWDVAFGSNARYASSIGDYHYPELGSDFDHGRIGHRVIAQSYSTLKDKGIDPLKVVIDYVHGMDMELLGSYRVGGWVAPPVEETGLISNRFYDEHPEWRCVDWDGRPIARMSYAFPGVQQFVISILREVVERGADGVCLNFIRGVPCVLYEQPLVDGFKEKYGQDPRDLAQDDRRWLEYKATWITDFVRSVRREMDELSQHLGRRVQVSAYVLDNVPYCLSYGLDVGTWARDGLVDFIIPNPTRNKRDESGGEGVYVDAGSFARLTRGTNCKLYADMFPRLMSPADYRQRALEYYAAGADGLAFWDTSTAPSQRLCYLDQWSMVRRLGHRDELSGWAPDEWPSYRDVPLYNVKDVTMDRHSPYWYG